MLDDANCADGADKIVPPADLSPAARAFLDYFASELLWLRSAEGTGSPWATIVDDSQMFGGLLSYLPDQAMAGVQIYGSHGGFVGSGLSTAVGYAVAAPKRHHVIALLGDQGFLNGVKGLGAVARTRAELTIVVCNNGAAASLVKQAKADRFTEISRRGGFLSNNLEVDYCQIARGYGLTVRQAHYELKQSPPRVELSDGAVRLFASAGRPLFIELNMPSSSSFWSGVWRTHGLEQETDVLE